MNRDYFNPGLGASNTFLLAPCLFSYKIIKFLRVVSRPAWAGINLSTLASLLLFLLGPLFRPLHHCPPPTVGPC